MATATHVLRSIASDGSNDEVELTSRQAHTLGAGAPLAYFPHDERLLITHEGRVVRRESAVPA